MNAAMPTNMTSQTSVLFGCEKRARPLRLPAPFSPTTKTVVARPISSSAKMQAQVAKLSAKPSSDGPIQGRRLG